MYNNYLANLNIDGSGAIVAAPDTVSCIISGIGTWERF